MGLIVNSATVDGMLGVYGCLVSSRMTTRIRVPQEGREVQPYSTDSGCVALAASLSSISGYECYQSTRYGLLQF